MEVHFLKVKTLILSLGILLSQNALADKAIKLMADEWCPYNCDPLKEPGYAIEIFNEIFKTNDKKIIYKISDWTDAINMTRTGKNDVLVAATVGDAPDLIFPKNEIGDSRLCFYANNSVRWKYKGLENLSKIKLGVVKSYSYGDKLDEYIKKNLENSSRLDFTLGNAPLEAMTKKLLNQKIDLIVENEYVMSHFLNNTKQNTLFKNIGCEETVKLYMAFSPKNPDAEKLANDFDQGIQELRKNGRLKEILQKYSINDWQIPVTTNNP